MCEVLHCLPDELDRQDDARIQQIVIWLNAKQKRQQRDMARQRATQAMNARGD